MSKLLRIYRVAEWAPTKLPLLWVVYWATLGERGNLGSWAALTAFSCALLAFGYAVNDYSDREVDAIAGKVREFHSLSLSGQFLTLTIPVALGGVAAWSLGLWALSGALVAFALAMAYSLPPLRFKERALLGPLVASIAQRVTPALPLLVVHIPGISAVVALGLGWLTGLRAILVHQLLDEEADRRSGVRTTTTTFGRRTARSWLYQVVLPAEVALTVALPPLLARSLWGDTFVAGTVAYLLLGGVAALLWLLVRGWQPHTVAFRTEHGPSPAWSIHHLVLPMIAAAFSGSSAGIGIGIVQLVWVLPQTAVWVRHARNAAVSISPGATSARDGATFAPFPVSSRGYAEMWFSRAQVGGDSLLLELKQSGNAARPTSCSTTVQLALIARDGTTKLSVQDQCGGHLADGGPDAFQFRGSRLSVDLNASDAGTTISVLVDGGSTASITLNHPGGTVQDADFATASRSHDACVSVGTAHLALGQEPSVKEAKTGTCALDRMWFSSSPESVLRRWRREMTIDEHSVAWRLTSIPCGIRPILSGVVRAAADSARRDADVARRGLPTLTREVPLCDWWWAARSHRLLGRQSSRTSVWITADASLTAVDEVWL